MSRTIISFIAIAALTFAPVAHAVTACEPGLQAQEDCKAEGQSAIDTYTAESAAAQAQYDKDHNTNAASGLIAQANTKCGLAMATASKDCRDKQKPKCSQSCPDAGTVKKCQDAIEAMAAGFDKQTTSCGKAAIQAKDVFDKSLGGPNPGDNGGSDGGSQAGGGGSDALMPMLAGAALGGLVGYMMGKDKKDDKKDDKKPEETGEDETPRTPKDCSPAGTESDSECNADYETKCTQDPAATGCSTFMASYCSNETPPVADAQGDPATDQVKPASNKGQGVGSAFCNTVAFCAGGKNQNCLTCIEASRPKSETCLADPSTCISQYSQSEIDAAKVACPVDPKFLDSKLTAGTEGDTGSTDTTGNVILPRSIASGPASDIEGQYGKSVFSIGSSTFRKLCEEGRLNNCPVQ